MIKWSGDFVWIMILTRQINNMKKHIIDLREVDWRLQIFAPASKPIKTVSKLIIEMKLICDEGTCNQICGRIEARWWYCRPQKADMQSLDWSFVMMMKSSSSRERLLRAFHHDDDESPSHDDDQFFTRIRLNDYWFFIELMRMHAISPWGREDRCLISRFHRFWSLDMRTPMRRRRLSLPWFNVISLRFKFCLEDKDNDEKLNLTRETSQLNTQQSIDWLESLDFMQCN